MDEEVPEEGNQLEPDHDDGELTSKETDLEHQLEPEYGYEDIASTETDTEKHNEDKGSSLKETDTAEANQMEADGDDTDSSSKETDTIQKEADNDDEELSSREIDSDLNKSASLPSLADSEQLSNPQEEINDQSYNHTAAQNGDEHVPPSLHSMKKDRHIADALPNDFDLLADYDDDSVASSQDATKRTWSAFKMAFLISAPVFFVGLALLIMGAINFPPTFNLLTIGIPVFIIAGLVFTGSTLYLCFYKAKKMRLFEFGGDMDGEIAGVGNTAYSHDEETVVPNMAYNQETMLPDQGDIMPFTYDGETVLPTVVYTSEDQEENLPL